MNPVNAAQRPPWREPYVWMVAGIPVLAICLGVVDDNYYKRGVEINKDTAARQRATQLRMGVFVTQRPDGVCAHLQGESLPGASEVLNLRFAHIARREMDYVLSLTADATGRCSVGATDSGLQSRAYWAPAAVIQRGQWSASLAAQDWRLSRRAGPVDGQVLEIDSLATR
jgi:hypothetical protein